MLAVFRLNKQLLLPKTLLMYVWCMSGGKIVAALAIKDEKKFKQAQDIIASQYRALNQLHEGSKLKVQQPEAKHRSVERSAGRSG